jgi:putative transposase
VHAEVTAWPQRGLEPMYPVVFFDALRVKIRDEGTVRSKAVYLALAMLPDGSRDSLGIWIEQTEGATFWLKVFTDLKTRGCLDILIAVTDGLKGMSEALGAVYLATTRQTCVGYLLRSSVDVAPWKVRKELAAAQRPISTAPDADLAAAALDAFADGPWGQRDPPIVASWRRAWPHVIPFFVFPPDVRKVLATTNALESVHARLRNILKTRGHFRPTRLRPTSRGSPCATSPPRGARRPIIGGALGTSSRSFMVNASQRRVRRDHPLHTQNS